MSPSAAAVSSAHGVVVITASATTSAPQPARIHQPVWLAAASSLACPSAGTGNAPTSAIPHAPPTRPLVGGSAPALPAGGAVPPRHARLRGRHAGHRGVGDRRVDRAEADPEHEEREQEPLG